MAIERISIEREPMYFATRLLLRLVKEEKERGDTISTIIVCADKENPRKGRFVPVDEAIAKLEQMIKDGITSI